MKRQAIAIVAIMAATLQCVLVQATDFSWTGSISNVWGNGLNWAPIVGTPGDGDTATIDSLVNSPVILLADVAFGTSQEDGIDALTVSGGASANTNGFLLHVDGAGGVTTVTGTDSKLSVGILASDPSGFAFDTDSLDVLSGATFDLNGGNVDVDSNLEIDSTSKLLAFGDMLLGSSGSNSVLDNRGTIEVSAPFTGAAGQLTLRIPGGAANATFDLDGSDEAGNVDVSDNQAPLLQQGALTLHVEAPLTDGFSGVLEIGSQDTANFTNQWTLESGTIQLAGGSLFPATLQGAKVSNLGGNIVASGQALIESEVGMAIGSQVNVETGATLTLAGNYTATGGSRDMVVQQDATVQFDATGVVSNGAALTLGANSQLVVNGDLTVDRGSDTFDWDGSADDAGTIVNGSLRVAAGGFDANGYSSTLTINEGSVTVDNEVFWLMRGTVNMTGGTGNSLLQTVGGSTALFEGATINAGGTGTNIIDATYNSFNNLVNVTVDPGAVLQINNPLVEGGRWTGGGTLEFTNLEVNGPTILSPHTVNLHGDTQIYDRLTLDVSELGQQGTGEITGNIVISQDGGLNVLFLDPGSSWKLPVGSSMTLNGTPAGSSLNSLHLAGADTRLQGDVIITGNSEWLARTDIEGAIDVALGSLRLSGGDLLNPNRVEGGEILSGLLELSSDTALTGFGTITARSTAPANGSALLADDGILHLATLGATFNKLGTADDDGILDFTSSIFNTAAAADALELNGGTVQAVDIFNDGVTRGHGLVHSNIFAQLGAGRISAQGGELTVTADIVVRVWNGFMEAVEGDLTFAAPLDGEFAGTASIRSEHVLTFDQGWTLGAGGTLNLIGTNATAPQVAGDTVIQGDPGIPATVNVTGGSNAFADFTGHVTFGTDANVNLGDPDSQISLFGGGSIEGTPIDQTVFAGDGSLVNLPGSQLNIADELTVGVHLKNRGKLAPGNSIGTVYVAKEFTNFSEGVLEMEFASGPGGVDHDFLDVSGTAALAGTLELTFTAVNATYGDEFVLVQGSSIVGTFESIQGIELATDQFIAVVYDATTVKSVVALPGDANLDGTVDGTDFLIWNTNKFATGTSWATGDFDGNGTTDGADFLLWNTYKFTSVDMLNAVPEPSLTLLPCMMFILHYRRGRTKPSLAHMPKRWR